MQFLKGVWTFLVGVKDALVLLFMLLVFGVLWASLSSGSPRITVPEGAALHVDLDGLLVDQAQQASPLAFVTGEPVIPETETAQLVKAIDLAAEDPAIRMITLDLDGFMGGGLANLESVGNALVRFRAKGKRVESWATAYGDDGYYLAAHADSVGLSPMGAVLISGPGGKGLYFKDALDRLKVNVEVFRVGTYKSFVEPFTRNDSSPEARAADQALADDLWAGWRTGVEKQRKGLDMAALTASWPARLAGANRDQANLAKDAGLVDVVQSDTAWRTALVKTLGEGDDADLPGDYKRIDVRDYLASRGPLSETGPAVAVVHVSGSIVDGDAPPGQAGGDTIAEMIDEATADGDIKALVVRVDSPGGSALASERIRLAMLEARARKMPVIASFGPVAASGGYWVGTGAETIFASPNTITGSIGVFGIIPTFERTLGELGVSADGVTTTPFSGQPDLVGGLNEPTRALIQGGVEDIYRQFLTLVSQSRKMPVAEVAPIAEGRVWSGTRAKQLKLVDQFGDLDAAVAEAGRRAGIEGKPRVVVMTQPQPWLVEILSQLEGQTGTGRSGGRDALSRAVTASRMRSAAEVEAAINVAKGPSIQAQCLSCARFGLARGTGRAPETLLKALQARFLD
jgi:protease-4